jgi:hypothetical protein
MTAHRLCSVAVTSPPYAVVGECNDGHVVSHVGIRNGAGALIDGQMVTVFHMAGHEAAAAHDRLDCRESMTTAEAWREGFFRHGSQPHAPLPFIVAAVIVCTLSGYAVLRRAIWSRVASTMRQEGVPPSHTCEEAPFAYQSPSTEATLRQAPWEAQRRFHLHDGTDEAPKGSRPPHCRA